MIRTPRNLAVLLVVFALGALVGRGLGTPPAAADPAPPPQDQAKADPYARMLHVGVLVRDLDEAVAKWKALGFTDIQVLPESKGIDRTHHGEPIDAGLKQAFIRGTEPPIELMEPTGPDPGPWGDYLQQHGEVLHHLAFRIPDAPAELAKYQKAGFAAIASGKWEEGDTHFGVFHYVQEPDGGAVIEFISRIPRD